MYPSVLSFYKDKPSSSAHHRLPQDCPANTVEFLRGMRDLQEAGTFCDVVLKGSDASSQGIPCHRSVLTVQSPYFRAAFTHNWKESSAPVFRLANIDNSTLKELVTYAYTMDLRLSDDNVVPILIAAQFLQMTPAARLCWKYVKERLCLSTCLDIHALASHHSNPSLANAALHVIHPNFLTVAQTKEFLLADAQQLAALIASDKVEVFNEDQVWEAVKRWQDHDRPGRMAHLAAVLQNVRAAFLSDEYRKDWQSAYGLHVGDGQNTAPRHSYKAKDVILCVGGCEVDYDDYTAPVTCSVYAFSPSIPAVWRLKDLPAFGEGCHAVLLDAATILILHRDGMHTVRRSSRYLGLRNEWRNVVPMRTQRREAALAELNGRIYVASQEDKDPLTPVEAFDPKSSSWFEVASIPIALNGFAMVACDGRLFVLGGDSHEEESGRYVFSYDPGADHWTRLRDMPTECSCIVACVGAGGLIFVFGGDDSAERCVRVDAYDPTSDQWVRKADMIRERLYPGCAYLDGKLYAVGGDRWVKNGYYSIEVYDDETDSWTLLPKKCRLPENAYNFDCVVMKMKPEFD
ncbi:kelch-like protein 20 [Paramacrobiotus metropolitanus]|uniref:kelch-like protein 20 n=1 Tax=Paramacrobiotus metropolitanus TaxID=2943436 RepID=UPI002445DD62|nr:kelch-like protein 20 [Paramacrobiotus metropolitanus]